MSSPPPYGNPPGDPPGGGYQGGGYPPPPGGYQGGGYPPPPGGYSGGNYPPPPPPRRSGMVGQVTVIAILMIVQGGLVCLVGLLLLIMGPAMFAYSGSEFRTESDRMGATVAGSVYMVLGGVFLLIGGLNILAGVKNLKYRGRTLGIVAMSIGLVAVFTCYCALTAIGVMIYGLIVYLNEDVRRAFEMGEQGASPDQIKNAL